MLFVKTYTHYVTEFMVPCRHFSSIRILYELQAETSASNAKDNIKPRVNGGIIAFQVCHALVCAD